MVAAASCHLGHGTSLCVQGVEPWLNSHNTFRERSVKFHSTLACSEGGHGPGNRDKCSRFRQIHHTYLTITALFSAVDLERSVHNGVFKQRSAAQTTRIRPAKTVEEESVILRLREPRSHSLARVKTKSSSEQKRSLSGALFWCSHFH